MLYPQPLRTVAVMENRPRPQPCAFLLACPLGSCPVTSSRGACALHSQGSQVGPGPRPARGAVAVLPDTLWAGCCPRSVTSMSQGVHSVTPLCLSLSGTGSCLPRSEPRAEALALEAMVSGAGGCWGYLGLEAAVRVRPHDGPAPLCQEGRRLTAASGTWRHRGSLPSREPCLRYPDLGWQPPQGCCLSPCPRPVVFISAAGSRPTGGDTESRGVRSPPMADPSGPTPPPGLLAQWFWLPGSCWTSESFSGPFLFLFFSPPVIFPRVTCSLLNK